MHGDVRAEGSTSDGVTIGQVDGSSGRVRGVSRPPQARVEVIDHLSRACMRDTQIARCGTPTALPWLGYACRSAIFRMAIIMAAVPSDFTSVGCCA
jgi:hypothetical protein